MRTICSLVLVFLLGGCVQQDAPVPQQVAAKTETQAYMISRMQQLEGAYGIGAYLVDFSAPPVPNAAGWASCPQNGPPWKIHINDQWIEMDYAQKLGRGYLDEVLAHEMCHVWLTVTTGACPSGEDAANACRISVLQTGRPR